MDSKCEKVIVRLMGGLGNQMFQYAAGLEIAKAWGAQLEIDISLLAQRNTSALEVQRDFELGALFSGPFKIANKLTCSSLYPTSTTLIDRVISKGVRVFAQGELRIQQGNQHYCHSQPNHSIIGIVGRFHSQDYFKGSEHEVRKSFQFQHQLTCGSNWVKELTSLKNAVGVHVRRGDYVSHPIYSKKIGFVGERYLNEAMRVMEKLVGSKPIFVVFSDDHNWCEQFFGKEVIILKESFLPNPAHSDFMLLSKFKNLIISNSTFGWWAAKLSEPRAQNIIAPKRWGSQGVFDPRIVPKTWVQI